MTWLGLLLAAIAATDLARSLVPAGMSTRVPAWAAGVAVLLLLTLLTGGSGAWALAGLLAGAVVVAGWDLGVRRLDAASGPAAAVPALLVLGVALLVALLAAPWSPQAGGPVASWLAASPWPTLAGLHPERAVLLLGVVGVQLSTGNVVVRLVLRATGTAEPARRASASGPAEQLRGGRLLGPMERLVILGLGLAGQLTAASIVIAAKGLLRWAERQAGPWRSSGAGADDPTGAAAWDVHRVTEYFLVGSFVSWLVALAGLVLAR